MTKYKLITAILLCTFVIQFNTFADNINVSLNGAILDFDVPPQIISDRTFVPMRNIFESLGATVEWDDVTKTVTGRKDDTVVNLSIGSTILLKNGLSKTLDVAPIIVNSRTLVPIRAIAESFNCAVQWDEASKTVIIISEHSINEREIFDENGYIEFDGLKIVYCGIKEDSYTNCYTFDIYNTNDFDIILTLAIVGVKKDGTNRLLGCPAFWGYDIEQYEKDKKENGWAIKDKTNRIKAKTVQRQYAAIYALDLFGTNEDEYVGMDPDNDGFYDIKFISNHQKSDGSVVIHFNSPESVVYKLQK